MQINKENIVEIFNQIESECNIKQLEDDQIESALYEYYKKMNKADLSKLLEYYKVEQEVQNAINTNTKIKINALYGILSNKYCRWKLHANAEAITSSGQLCVRGVGNYLVNKSKMVNPLYSLKTIYFDTDSAFLVYDNYNEQLNKMEYNNRIDTIIDTNKKILIPLIKEYFNNLALNLNCVENKIKMDFELISDESIFLAQKKYIMRKSYDDGKRLTPENNKFKFRGVEIVKTSTPQFFRDKLQEAVIIVFNKTESELIEFIKKTKNEYLQLAFVDMSNPSGISDIDKYKTANKNIPFHVNGALAYNKFITNNNLLNKYELITNKAKIKYSYIKTPNKLKVKVISVPNNVMPTELLKVIELDYEHQFDKNFISPIKRIADAINWKTEHDMNVLLNEFDLI